MPPKKTASTVETAKSKVDKRKRPVEASIDDPPSKRQSTRTGVTKTAQTPQANIASKRMPKVVASTKAVRPGRPRLNAQAPLKKSNASTKARTLPVPEKANGPKKITNKEMEKVNAETINTVSDSDVDVVQRKRKAGKTADVVASTVAKKVKVGQTINDRPTHSLDVFVMGEGGMGELGLGTSKKAQNVKRPRLHAKLVEIGIAHVAVGGMHAAAISEDNRIYTWGVNDNGALGRDTTWSGGLRGIDADSDSDSDDDDNGLNPAEAEPRAIPMNAFPEGIVFAQLAAGDSCTFALTTDGSVYGWGTFRNNEGVIGFAEDGATQRTPILIPELKNIVQITCGSNFALALSQKGRIFAWGSGQQCQLGRRIVERTAAGALKPRELRVSKNPKHPVKYLGAGADHAFAINSQGEVYAWGLNCMGECSIPEAAGDGDAVVSAPTLVKNLSGRELVAIDGGLHHSIALTKSGECLVWGRADAAQLGIDVDSLPREDLKFNDHGKPAILLKPHPVPGLACSYVAAGSDTCMAITTDGRAFSWGFSATYQTGLGTSDDVLLATHIDNTATRGKKLTWAGCGGQYSMLASIHASSSRDVPLKSLTNGAISSTNGGMTAAKSERTNSASSLLKSVSTDLNQCHI